MAISRPLFLVLGLSALASFPCSAAQNIDSSITSSPSSASTTRLAALFTRLKAGEKIKVVTFGTSLTKYGSWVAAMTEWFQQAYPGQVTVVNAGGPGQTSVWGLQSLESKVIQEKPDMVTLEFSYNDAHQRFKLTPESSKHNLDGMVQSLEAANPKIALILQTMNAPWDNAKGFTAAADRPRLEEFNQAYRDYSREHKLPLADNYPDFARLLKDSPDRYHSLVPDGSHPNKEASLAITWPHMRAILEAGQTASPK